MHHSLLCIGHSRGPVRVPMLIPVHRPKCHNDVSMSELEHGAKEEGLVWPFFLYHVDGGVCSLLRNIWDYDLLCKPEETVWCFRQCSHGKPWVIPSMWMFYLNYTSKVYVITYWNTILTLQPSSNLTVKWSWTHTVFNFQLQFFYFDPQRFPLLRHLVFNQEASFPGIPPHHTHCSFPTPDTKKRGEFISSSPSHLPPPTSQHHPVSILCHPSTAAEPETIPLSHMLSVEVLLKSWSCVVGTI